MTASAAGAEARVEGPDASGRKPGGRVVLAATASTALALLPPTLVGALAVQMQSDLGFGAVGLGGATAAFFAATALTSVLGGRVAERLGAERSMLVAAFASTGCLLGVAGPVRTYEQLLAFLVLGGIANALAQPSCNLALSRGVRWGRQGIAFGAKQSAVPLASLLAGASVPLLAVTWGWRPAVAAVAATGLVVAALVPRRGHAPARGRVGVGHGGEAPRLPWAGLLVLAGSCCLGTSAALSLSTFAVDSAVADGVPDGTAGWVLSAGAAASIAVRLTSGWAADRWQLRPLVGAAGLLLAGTVGYLLLSAGPSRTWLLSGAVVLSVAAGWGWPALFSLMVVRVAPQSPATATGVTQAGGALGGVIGPLTFGAVVAHSSYAAAWQMAAGTAGMAAAGMLLGHRLAGRATLAGPRGT